MKQTNQNNKQATSRRYTDWQQWCTLLPFVFFWFLVWISWWTNIEMMYYYLLYWYLGIQRLDGMIRGVCAFSDISIQCTIMPQFPRPTDQSWPQKYLRLSHWSLHHPRECFHWTTEKWKVVSHPWYLRSLRRGRKPLSPTTSTIRPTNIRTRRLRTGRKVAKI